jgi:hypothetical protein
MVLREFHSKAARFADTRARDGRPVHRDVQDGLCGRFLRTVQGRYMP